MHCLRCKNTGIELGKNSTYTRKDGSTSSTYMCRPCNTLRLQEYRKTDSGKKSTYKASKKYHESNRERQKAWDLCRHLGTKPCEKCNEPNTDKHHPDVSKPLEVIWLCRLHHKERHRLELIV